VRVRVGQCRVGAGEDSHHAEPGLKSAVSPQAPPRTVLPGVGSPPPASNGSGSGSGSAAGHGTLADVGASSPSPPSGLRPKPSSGGRKSVSKPAGATHAVPSPPGAGGSAAALPPTTAVAAAASTTHAASSAGAGASSGSPGSSGLRPGKGVVVRPPVKKIPIPRQWKMKIPALRSHSVRQGAVALAPSPRVPTLVEVLCGVVW
jgi:hypothetical protein